MLSPTRLSRRAIALLAACAAGVLAWHIERSFNAASLGLFTFLSPPLVLGTWTAFSTRAHIRADALRLLALFALFLGANLAFLSAFDMTPRYGACIATAALVTAALAPAVLLMRLGTHALKQRFQGIQGGAALALLLGQLVPAIAAFPVFMLASAVHRAQGVSRPRGFHMPVQGERIAFIGASGTPLVGLWFEHPAPRGAVMLLHGIGAEKTQFLPAVESIYRRGYHVFSYDQRNHGESGGLSCTLGLVESDDAARAFQVLRERTRDKALKRVIVGISMGGAAAQMALPKLEGLDGLILDSTFARIEPIARGSLPFGMFTSPLVAIGKLFAVPLTGQPVLDVAPVEVARSSSWRGPVLILHAKGDPLIPFSDAEQLARAYGDRARLVALDDDHHANGFSFDAAHYRAAIADFLDEIEAR